ncbi:hypothetical protein, partial [Mycobacterium marinum]|uniref:hypothetical protein n=1 Tax=Mycobacterium marinum TaxID=1781 RepID=UPI003567A6AF
VTGRAQQTGRATSPRSAPVTTQTAVPTSAIRTHAADTTGPAGAAIPTGSARAEQEVMSSAGTADPTNTGAAA